MSWFRQSVHEQIRSLYFTPLLALVIVIMAGDVVRAQSNRPPTTFQAGQSMYIVAFRRYHFPVFFEGGNPVPPPPEYINDDLDAERKVRKRIEEWQYFKIAEKPSQADFIFLVHLDESSIEGLAVPFDAYRRHFKENFDLDALREAALGRYLIGPLKLPTLSRLTDRLVKQFRERVGK